MPPPTSCCVLLREFDANSGWGNGFLSCAHWLHWRTGIDLGAAREKGRAGRQGAGGAPAIDISAARRWRSWTRSRRSRDLSTPRSVRGAHARGHRRERAHAARLRRGRHGGPRRDGWSAAGVASIARKKPGRRRARHLNRQLAMWVDDDGMVVIRGRRHAARWVRWCSAAIEAAADRLFRDGAKSPTAGSVSEECNLAQRRRRRPSRFRGNVAADRLRRLGRPDDARRRWHRAGRRTQDAVDSAGDPPGARRRDRKCRFPGCASRWCDAHHVVHWADGGPTSLDNLLLLCRRHHRAVHEGGFAVWPDADDGSFTFVRPDGTPIPEAPSAAAAQPRRTPGGPTGDLASRSGTGRPSTSPGRSTCCVHSVTFRASWSTRREHCGSCADPA